MENTLDKMIDDLQKSEGASSVLRAQIVNILDILDVAVFFLEAPGTIEELHSKSLPGLLNEEILADRSFVDILENKIPQKTISETQEYLDLMFGSEHDEETLSELNPIKSIELHYKNDTGLWNASKYLSFRFKRCPEKSGEMHLIGLVSDISNQVELTRKLNEFEKWSQRQMQWLISLLHIELPLLTEFVAVVEYELNKIDSIIKSTQSGTQYSKIIPQLNRSTYHINSSAIILNLDFFSKESLKLKEEVELIKKKSELTGQDFIPLVMQLGNMYRMLREIKELMQHIKGLDNSLRTTRRFDGGLLIRMLENLIQHLTASSDKRVIFKYHNFDHMAIPFKYKQITKEFLIALTRFVVEFGIENCEKRKSLNVNPAATIEVESEIKDRMVLIRFRHDGNIVRIERILEQSVEEENRPAGDPAGVDESMHPGSQVLRLFFTPDIAALENKGTTESMRIMNEFEMVKKKLKIHGGRIKVTFTSESFCEYTINFPYTGQPRN